MKKITFTGVITEVQFPFFSAEVHLFVKCNTPHSAEGKTVRFRLNKNNYDRFDDMPPLSVGAQVSIDRFEILSNQYCYNIHVLKGAIDAEDL